MAKFQGCDYYNMDSILSEEEILVRNTVREFVDENILPIIEKHNRAGTFPFDLIAKISAGTIGETDRTIDALGALEGVERTVSSVVLATKLER